MKTILAKNVLLIAFLFVFVSTIKGQTTTTSYWEAWPAVKANFELAKQTRLQIYGEEENGEDFGYLQWKAGALLNYRLKEIRSRHVRDIDEENEYNLGLNSSNAPGTHPSGRVNRGKPFTY